MSALARPGDPDVRTLAGYVLRKNMDPMLYAPPGDFYALLVDAVFKADRQNRARLAQGFPLLADMVNAFKDSYDGVDRLKHAHATGEWT